LTTTGRQASSNGSKRKQVQASEVKRSQVCRAVLYELRYRYPSVVKLPLIGDFIHAHHIMHRFMQPSAGKRNQVKSSWHQA
jgi:hypothetical protein